MTTGEALNKRYHELTRSDIYPMCKYSGCTHEDDPAMPALHLDANLCIAEADRVFVKWDMARIDDPTCGNASLHFTFNAVWDDDYRDACGVTFCEAILAALVAKKEAERG